MAKITRSANAVWTGTGTEGGGSLTTASGALSNVVGRNALQRRQGHEPGRTDRRRPCGLLLDGARLHSGRGGPSAGGTARATIEKMDEGWRFVGIELEVVGRVPGISREDFVKHAEAAKAGCPVSNVLNTDITLKADLA